MPRKHKKHRDPSDAPHTEDDIVLNAGSGGKLPTPVLVPPKPGPPSGGEYLPFAHHIQTKLDQIAYVTNLLFSLTFIATVYGMNLDIFTDGGLVGLSRYLATALPFAFLVFMLTFGIPILVSRLSKGQMRRNFAVDLV
jgi:hypothetical protein